MENEIHFNFEKLVVYQKSKDYVKLIYQLLETFPKGEQYALCDQLKRAAISVPSNIAEGISRQTAKDRMHFLDISYGSLMESFCQMDMARELGYITEEELQTVKVSVFDVYKLLAGLKNSLKTQGGTIRTND